ncbi:nucleotidyltransferase domain-containing protein [Nocardioides sp. LML1-1-1.1]|uniref:nucleotidyltransferase domain-containing protein n=1 Tax=Nocardioides sp. LML1-1-1.1 TaxID=3135248 RepID=UPI0034335D14
MPVASEVQELLDSHPHLSRARTFSEDRIDDFTSQLARYRTDDAEGLDVVAFGSLARREATAESDFDHLVLATRVPDDPDVAQRLLGAADELRKRWAVEEGKEDEANKPGASGVFGCAVGAFDLVHQIGLQEDTNHSLTRRMLLLEESVSLLDETVHRNVIDSTLRRYLELDRRDPTRVPRFLLNDVTRYWHTITVDYQAKARTGVNESGLRYIKLLIPRKILFAGTLMSLMLCGKEGWHLATADHLREQFSITPLERLVQALPTVDTKVHDAMVGIVGIADRYLERSADEEWRETVKKASKTSTCHEFDEMREHASDLQAHLETIFFDWDLIAADSKRMLAF